MEGECRLNMMCAFSESPAKENRKRKRTADPGRRVVSGRIYDSALGKSCHWCRQKTVDARVECSRAGCKVLFCEGCLRNRHGEDISDQSKPGVSWVCPRCRGGCGTGCTVNCCNCGKCRKSQGLHCTGQMIFEARGKGFNNVHDYLVHLETGEPAEAIARRKIGRQWIAEPESTLACVEVTIQDHVSEAWFGQAQRLLLEQAKTVVEVKRKGEKDEAESDNEGGSGNTDANMDAEDKRPAKRMKLFLPPFPVITKVEVEGDDESWKRDYYDDSGDSDIEEDVYWGREQIKTKVEEQPQHELLNQKQAEVKRQQQKPAFKKSLDNFLDREEERPSKSSVTEDDSEASSDEDEYAEEDYTEKLAKTLSKPFDIAELKHLIKEASDRKPLLKHRETRHGTSSVATGAKAASYLDRYPVLARKLAAGDIFEKLRLLRGFFFWIQHACHPGAFQPWLDAADDNRKADPDCKIVGDEPTKPRRARRKWTWKPGESAALVDARKNDA